MKFTDYYGEQTCTAGRSSFVTGQSVFRTGLSKVALPGSDLGLQVEYPTFARLLKAQGEFEDATKELESSKGAVTKQTQQVAKMTADMGGFAAAAYRQGVLDPTLHMVLSDDISEALNESVMLDAYAGQQASALAVVASERAALSAKQADVEEKTALLDDIEQEIEKEKKALDSKVEEAESLLSSLKEEEREVLAEIEAEREREEERRAEAAARAARDAERDEPEQETQQESSPAPAPAPEPQPAPPSASGRAATAVNFAMAQIGDAYVYGGTGPNGWDCSGLTSGCLLYTSDAADDN